MALSDLPTMAEVNATRRAIPKHELGNSTVTKEDKRQAKKKSEENCRNEVWKRDKSRCRATRVKLVRSGTTDPHLLGEVDHAINRSLAPGRVLDITNQLLLSKYLNRLRKDVCRNAPQFHRFEYDPVDPKNDDRKLPQIFRWRDPDGKVTKTRIG